MPATYRKVLTKEEIERDKQYWRQKRTQPRDDIEPKEYWIFGYEVDAATYKKFNRQDYRVGFGFFGLSGVERWANNTDYPEEAAKAKAIMDNIITQITGKDVKNMNNPKTAADFIAALNDIYTESRATYDALYGAVEKAKAKMDRANEELRAPGCKNRELAQAKYDIARGEHRVAEDELRNEYRKMITGHDQKVSELRKQFADYLDEHYSASPDKLDTATMQLLNTGICKPTELARLAERHSDNPTMLRIIGNFARNMRDEQRKHLTHDEQVICTNVANAGYQAKDGSRELALFDSAVSSAAYGLGKEYVHATRMHSLVSGWMDDFKNQIMNMSWKPAETAGAAGTGDASGGDE